jgi:filamentous hemagglutinin family protein
MKRRTHKLILYALLLGRAGVGMAQNVPVAATQLPTGGNVVGGQASIQASGAAMTVNQSSARAVIDWNTFNVGSQAKVNFNQPSPSAVVLNRVLDSSPSQILGQLSATGQVFISNPNGVIFGTSARVDVGGLVATTQSMSTADFMAGKGMFAGGSPDAAVVNQGSLQAALGGYIALLAPQVRNEGVIVAREGTVALAAGAKTTLDFSGTRLVSVMVEQPVLNALIENKQLIRAEGGYVVMAARSASTLMRAVINNTGSIQAPSLVEKEGRIVLEGGSQGIVQVGGSLNVGATDNAAKGGAVVATGDKVLVSGDARIDATGPAGGGRINIGGGWQGQDPHIQNANAVVVEAGATLNASATNQGQGGEVVVYANTNNATGVTRVAGELLARGGPNGGNGGRIETSGHWISTDGAKGDASAAKGEAGQWLFDPLNVSISTATNNNSATAGTWTPSGSSSTILNTAINDLLNAGTSVTVTTGSSGSDAGNITVDAPITQNPTALAAKLTLNANKDIAINQAVTMTQSGSKLELISQSAGQIGLNANVQVDSTSIKVTGQGSVIQSAGTKLVTTNLAIDGAQTNVTLDNANNNVGVLAANVNALTLRNDVGIDLGSSAGLGLFIGSVGDLSGLKATNGAIKIRSNGNIFVGKDISTGSTTSDAIVLNAGYGLAANTLSGSDPANPYGPNVILSTGKTITTGTGGRAIIYMGSSSQTGSSGSVTAAYVATTGTTQFAAQANQFRYNSVEDTGTPGALAAGITALGNSGLYLVTREQPKLTVTPDAKTITYGDAAPSANTLTSTVSGYLNGDTLANAITQSGSVSYDNTLVSTSGKLIAGQHDLTPSGAVGKLGYGFTYAKGTLTVNKATISVSGLTVPDKIYDGTLDTPITTTGFTPSGVVQGDLFTLVSSNGLFDTKNAGTGKTVSLSNVYGGADKGNYTITDQSTSKGTILTRPLLVTARAFDKQYDGTKTAQYSLTSDKIDGDEVNLSAVSALFVSANAGNNISVNVGELSIAGGAQAANYNLAQPATTTKANILPRDLTITGTTASSKPYDSYNTATITQVGMLSGLVSGESLGVTATGTFAAATAGSSGVTAVYTLQDTATGLASNYHLGNTTGISATINKRVLTLSTPTTAQDKVYDGNTTAAVTVGTLSNFAPNETITATGTGTFDSPNVGNRTVTATYKLSDPNNYSLPDSTGIAAAITRRPLTIVGAQASDKFEDGTNVAVVSPGMALNLVSGDKVPISATGTFDSASPGTWRVNGNYTITDATANGNYQIVSTPALAASIYQRPVKISDGCSTLGSAGGCVNTNSTSTGFSPLIAALPVNTTRPSLASNADASFAVNGFNAPTATNPGAASAAATNASANLVGPAIPGAANNVNITNNTNVQSLSVAQMRALPAALQNQIMSQLASSTGSASVTNSPPSASSLNSFSAIRGLTAQALAGLSASQVESILASLSGTQLLSLSQAQVNALSSAARSQLVQLVGAARETRNLSSAQIANLSSAELASKLPYLTDTQLMALSETQVRALDAQTRANLAYLLGQNDALKQLVPAQVAALSPDHLSVLLPYLNATPAQVRALSGPTRAELNAIVQTINDIRALNSRQVQLLMPSELANMMPYMSANQLLAINVGQASGLTPAQRQTLSGLLDNIAQTRSLSQNQIAAMSATQLTPLLRFMSPAQLLAISDRQITSLPPAGQQELLTQLESAARGGVL